MIYAIKLFKLTLNRLILRPITTTIYYFNPKTTGFNVKYSI
jgi:hypothetical protein